MLGPVLSTLIGLVFTYGENSLAVARVSPCILCANTSGHRHPTAARTVFLYLQEKLTILFSENAKLLLLFTLGKEEKKREKDNWIPFGS